MKRWTQGLTVLAMSAACAAAGAQSVYKWQDANGRWVFGDNPAPQVRDAQKVNALPGKKLAAEPGDPNPGESVENDKAAKLFPVILYASNCGEGCDKARAMLTARRIPFTVKDPSLAGVFEEFKKVSPGAMAPALLVGEKALIAFNPAVWSAALDEAGYAQTASKPPVSR